MYAKQFPSYNRYVNLDGTGSSEILVLNLHLAPEADHVILKN